MANQKKYLEYDGLQYFTNKLLDKLVPMTGATSSADGNTGFVPTPHSGEQNKILRGNGAWGSITENDVKSALGYTPARDDEYNYMKMAEYTSVVQPDLNMLHVNGIILIPPNNQWDNLPSDSLHTYGGACYSVCSKKRGYEDGGGLHPLPIAKYIIENETGRIWVGFYDVDAEERKFNWIEIHNVNPEEINTEISKKADNLMYTGIITDQSVTVNPTPLNSTMKPIPNQDDIFYLFLSEDTAMKNNWSAPVFLQFGSQTSTYGPLLWYEDSLSIMEAELRVSGEYSSTPTSRLLKPLLVKRIAPASSGYYATRYLILSPSRTFSMNKSGLVPAPHMGDDGKILGTYGWTTIDKSSIGLDNVDNTSDANKPVSTATQTALDLKADKTETKVIANLGAKNLANIPDKTETVSGVTISIHDNLCKITGTITSSSFTGFIYHDDNGMTFDFDTILSKYTKSEGIGTRLKIKSATGTMSYPSLETDYRLKAGDTLLQIYVQKSSDAAGTTIDVEIPVMLRPADISDGTFIPYAPTNRELYEGFKTSSDTYKAEIATIANMGAKNMFLPIETKTSYGNTLTNNGDGTYTVSGTPSQTVWYYVPYTLKKGRYTISMFGDENNKNIRCVFSTSLSLGGILGTAYLNEPQTFEVQNDTTGYLAVRVQQGYAAGNITVKPMLRPAEISDDTFVPYAPTNRALYESIGVLFFDGVVNKDSSESTSENVFNKDLIIPDCSTIKIEIKNPFDSSLKPINIVIPKDENLGGFSTNHVTFDIGYSMRYYLYMLRINIDAVAGKLEIGLPKFCPVFTTQYSSINNAFESITSLNVKLYAIK